MSTCISRDGEYGEHVYDGETLGSEFNCARCFAFDEERADAEVKRLRAQVQRVQAMIATWQPGFIGATPVIWNAAAAVRAALAGKDAADWPQAETDEDFHSRACGIRNHEHGSDCHENCPTCGGVTVWSPNATGSDMPL